MKAHSSAFETYRGLSQSHLDFVVVVCHAVPALRADIALPDQEFTFQPDYFKGGGNSKDWMSERVLAYQDELARTTLITAFSYFEAYVKDVLAEIVEFHGGKEPFLSLARERSSRFLSEPPPNLLEYKRKLQDNPEPAKWEKYQKFGRLLDEKGFRFPTDLMSSFGAQFLIQKLSKNKGMRAWEIPGILSECLLMNVDKEDLEMFEDARSLRNAIGHGRPPKIELKKALRISSQLHGFAAKVDRHVIEHFLVIQAV